jgi:hypothetical protein
MVEPVNPPVHEYVPFVQPFAKSVMLLPEQIIESDKWFNSFHKHSFLIVEIINLCKLISMIEF